MEKLHRVGALGSLTRKSAGNCMSAATLNNLPYSPCIQEEISAWEPIVQTKNSESILFGWRRDFRFGNNGRWEFHQSTRFFLQEAHPLPVLNQEAYLERAIELLAPGLELWFSDLKRKALDRYEQEVYIEAYLLLLWLVQGISKRGRIIGICGKTKHPGGTLFVFGKQDPTEKRN